MWWDEGALTFVVWVCLLAAAAVGAGLASAVWWLLS